MECQAEPPANQIDNLIPQVVVAQGQGEVEPTLSFRRKKRMPLCGRHAPGVKALCFASPQATRHT